MKVFMVWVWYGTGIQGSEARFLDSQWADVKHADARVDELDQSFRASGCKGSDNIRGFFVWKTWGLIPDVALPPVAATQEK